MLAENASVLVSDCYDFVLANKHTGSCNCIGFNSCRYRWHVSKDSIFEVTHHAFIVSNCPSQILSRKVGINTIREQHLSIFVGHLPYHDTFCCHETITFFIQIFQILVILTNMSGTKIEYNQAILHSQGASSIACTH